MQQDKSISCMPRLSIIVPVYNSERSLSRCIDSILSQSFTDFELLLINDGSKDSSLSICQEFASNDRRIKVLDKVNGGASSARNHGMFNAQGDWITFIDSDDWIGTSYFDNIDNDEVSDLIVGSLYFINSQTFGKLVNIDVFLENQDFRAVILQNLNNSVLNSPCAKFYRRSIITHNDIYFNEDLIFGEDSVFVKKYLLHVNNLKVQNSIIYYYDDIGEFIYEKYSKSFLPIYEYYNQISSLYIALGEKYDMSFSKKEVVGVVYNIAVLCLKRDGLKEWTLIKSFLSDQDVQHILRRRKSIHINIQLSLANRDMSNIFIRYFKLVEKLMILFNRHEYSIRK